MWVEAGGGIERAVGSSSLRDKARSLAEVSTANATMKYATHSATCRCVRWFMVLEYA